MKCRMCGCTHFDPCPGGCDWAERGLCSVCAAMRASIADYVEICRRVSKASLGRMLDEVYPAGKPVPRKKRRHAR